MTFTGKVLLTMRFTALILLCACLQVCAKGYAQITLSETDAPLQKVFKEIHKQTGYDFLYSSELLNQAGNITINLKNVTLKQAVEECLKGKELDFEIQEKTIIIKKKSAQSSALDNYKISSQIPPIEIHGHITDSSGNPLAGASISVKGSRIGTTTDSKGNFILTGISENAVLNISYTGYNPKQIRISGNNEINISLNKSSSPLDEIQVIAYGTTTQRLSTGNVSVVPAKVIEEQPVNDPLLALEGRVPGLFITQSNGLPGTGVTVRIQGQNSIQNGNDPLYVIDGVPYSSQLLPTLNSILGTSGGTSVNNLGTYGNPMSFINPMEIESISVLKDADATAIYGSRAANGAILITTKKGKASQMSMSASIKDGFGQVSRKLDLLNTPEYLQIRHEALRNDGLQPNPTGDYDLTLWDTTRNTDWQKVLLGGKAHYSEYNANLSGGSSNTQYWVGATYHRETNVFPGNFQDQRGSVNFNINSTSSNQKFHASISGSYLIDNNQLPNVDLTGTAITLAPDAPPLYNKDGSLNWAPNSSGSSTWTNPLSYLYQKYSVKTSNLFSDAVLSYQIINGLEIKSNFGYTNLQSNDIVTDPLVSHPPENRPTALRFASYGTNNINSWIVEPQMNYKKTIGPGKLEALIGTTFQQNNSNGLQLSAYGFNSDAELEDIQAAPHVQVQSQTQLVYKYNALFGSLKYNFDDRFIFDFTAGRDGSSRFGSQNEFHNFGSLGTAWIFSKEKFMKQLSFMSFGKIKASYGTTGSDQIGDYQYLSLYYPNTGNVGEPYQGISALGPNNLSNPYLQWEETKKINIGIDLGFLDDKILINSNYFINRSSNQLLGYSLPNVTGFSSINENFPATVQNSGLEITLTTVNINSKTFRWSSSINMTALQNKLLAFPNLANSSYANTLVIGKSINIIRSFHLLGVDPATGQFALQSKTDPFNPVMPDDQTVLINPMPTFYGGFMNTLTYKGFDLDIFFQFVRQIGKNYFYGNYPGAIGGGNQPTWILDRWQKPGDISSHQAVSSNYNNYLPYYNTTSYSDGIYTDASYIKLKNVSLTWQLPNSWLKMMQIRDFKIFVQGQNLLTITHYKGLDPETLNTQSLPTLRVFVFGLQLGL